VPRGLRACEPQVTFAALHTKTASFVLAALVCLWAILALLCPLPPRLTLGSAWYFATAQLAT